MGEACITDDREALGYMDADTTWSWTVSVPHLRFSFRFLNKLKLDPPACSKMARWYFAPDTGETQTWRWAAGVHEKAHELLFFFLPGCQGTWNVSDGNTELKARRDFPRGAGPQIWEAFSRTVGSQPSAGSEAQWHLHLGVLLTGPYGFSSFLPVAVLVSSWVDVNIPWELLGKA